MQPTITPFLWFDNQAEQAAALYTSIFPNSRILEVSRYGDSGPGQPGQAMTVSFELNGQHVIALNGGPAYHFTEAFSFVVNCETQDEVDRYWDALLGGGGREDQCAWLKDRYGLSWQIVPTILPKLLGDPDPERTGAVMQAMLRMKKIEVPLLQEAYDHPERATAGAGSRGA